MACMASAVSHIRLDQDSGPCLPLISSFTLFLMRCNDLLIETHKTVTDRSDNTIQYLSGRLNDLSTFNISDLKKNERRQCSEGCS